MIRECLGRVVAITLLGTLLAGNAHAELPPPLADNLVQDCSFEVPLESTPWEAESGVLSDMLCIDESCENCTAERGVIRFRGRQTDDVLAVKQMIELPPASSYELSFTVKYCATAPTGSITFSLGNFPEYTIQIASRPSAGFRKFVHTFENSGEEPVQPAGLAVLSIANPALDGADIMVDDVRIVPRYTERECALDPALLGIWRRDGNSGEASEDTWSFYENGVFTLNSMQGYYDAENEECCIYGTDYNGAWCVDTTQNPPAIYLRVDGEGYYESKADKEAKAIEPDCAAPERAWYGRYEIVEGQLSLRVQECPNPTLDAPPVFSSVGSASHNGSPLIADCAGPIEGEEGEGPAEGEGEGGVEGEGEPPTPSYPAPPHGDNLVADPSFEAQLAVTPWQAESGTLNDMLQRMNYFVGLCEYRSGLSSLRFRARDTADVLAVRQEVTLPSADYYDLSFYIARCSGDMTGNLGVSLGNASELIPIDMPQLDEYETESTRMTFRFDAAEVFSGKAEGEPSAMTLVIASPALSGADMYIDDVRLVTRDSADACSLDSDLVGTWLRRYCDDFEQDKWEFNADGSFQLTVDRYYSEGDTDYYFGTWCSDDTQLPPVVRLHVDRRAYYSDMNEWYEYTAPRDTEWFGRYERVEGTLQLKVSDCPVEDLVGAAVLGTGVPIASCAKFLTPCPTTEGEDPTEGEGEATVCEGTPTLDPALLGGWKRRECDGGPNQEKWFFFDDGRFSIFTQDHFIPGEEEDDALAGGLLYEGIWCIDDSQTPPAIEMRVDSLGEWATKGEGETSYPLNWYGRYEINGDVLSLRVQECPGAELGNAPTFQRIGVPGCHGYNGQPLIGECGGGEGCPSVPTSDASIVGTWNQRCEDSAGPAGLESLWVFNADGTFTYESTQHNDEVYSGSAAGSYMVDTSVTPHRIDLVFCDSCYQDIWDDEEGCGGWCCSNPYTNIQGIYAVDGDFLQFAYGYYGEGRPTAFGIQNIFKKDSPEFCPLDTIDFDLIQTWDWSCETAEHGESWSFKIDGTFEATIIDDVSGDRFEHKGRYAVDTSVTPHRIGLSYCRTCVTEEGDERDCPGFDEPLTVGEDCPLPTAGDSGAYEVDGDTLRLTFCDYSDAPVDLSRARVYSSSPVDCLGDFDTSCMDNGGPIDPALVDEWYRRCELESNQFSLTFWEDGTFVETSTPSEDTEYWWGTYAVDTSVTPHAVTLQYCFNYYESDMGEPLEFGCYPPFVDGFELGAFYLYSPVDYTKYGLYDVNGDVLGIVIGDTPPSSLSGAGYYSNNWNVRCLEGPPEGEGESPLQTLRGAVEQFITYDADADFRLSLEEALAAGLDEESFNSYDLNGDGYLHAGELLQQFAGDAPRHSADTNLDGVLSLGELLRAIQFYNAGGYSCAPLAESEDGYLPEPHAEKGVDPNCPAHAADYDPADGVISLSELLRAIQHYNTGAYTPCESGEDGFCAAD